MLTSLVEASQNLAVIPILIGPLQVLLAILPAILLAIGGVLISMLKPASIKIGLQVLWRNKFSTLITAAVIGGAIYGFSCIPGCHGGTAAAYQGKAEWTMFRGGLERRGGGTDGAPDPVGGGTVWSFAQKYKTYYSSPAIVGNRIVASAARKEVFADRGAIYCLDAQSGAMVWEFAPSDFRATFSSPSVAGKYVVCGEGLHETHDARIFCLSFETGRKLWEVRATSHVESSPAIAGNMAFCGAGADGVYAFHLDAPAGTNPVAWHLKGWNDTKVTFHCDASTAVAGGRVYFSSAELHDGDWNGIGCVDAATGKELWRVNTPVPVWGPPTIVSNRLFIGMGNGNFVESAEQYWARKQQELRSKGRSPAEIEALAPKYAAGGQLWSLDAQTGRTNWVRKMRQTMLGAVAAADGRLYFAAMDGLFTCITVDNELVAQWDAHEGIKSSPAIGKDLVYVATDSGRFFGLDRRTLHPVWQTRLGNGDLFTSSPAVGCGHIYIGTPENGLVCMGNPADQLPETVWAGAGGGPGKSGSLDGSTLPAKGAFVWRWPGDSAEGTNTASPVVMPTACLNGTLYAALQMPGQTGLVALAVGSSASEENPLAKTAPATNKWFAATRLPLSGAVAATTSRVYFTEGRTGDPGRKLHCAAAATGRDVWQVPVDAAASGEFVLTASNLFLYQGAGELACIATRGADAGMTRWSSAVGRTVGAPCPAGDLVLVATVKDGVMAMDSGTGKLLWKQPSPRTPLTGPVASDDMVAVAAADGLAGLSIVNGGALWRVKCAPAAVPLVMNEDGVLCTTAEGEIVMTGWDGKQRFRAKGVLPGMPAMICSDKLLLCGPGELRKVDLSEKNAESRWLKTDWLGAVLAPPILSDGTVYFATADKGLICARQGKR